MSLPVETLVQSLSLDAKLELFEVDLSPVTGTDTVDDHFYFHAGTNSVRQDIVWQGKTYLYVPAEASGFDVVTKGTMPRPKLAISNLNYVGSSLIESVGGDITGARVIRRQTFARYLDAVNYPPQVSLFTNTENQNNWTKNEIVVGLNEEMDLRGEMKANRLYETATTGVVHQVYNTTSATFAIGKKVTSWIEVKAGVGIARVQLGYGGSGGATGQLTIDPVTGKITSVGNVDYYSVKPLGDPGSGWWRMLIVSTISTAGTVSRRIRFQNNTGQGTYSGNPLNYLIVGRTQTFVGVVQQNPQSPMNLDQVPPYQYVGATYAPAPDADPNRHFADEIFFIERKVGEDDVSIEFELSSIVDFENLQLPRGIIVVGYCAHDEYRGEGCMYAGTAYFDAEDNPVTDPALDVCSRSPGGCKKRFGEFSPLPFGGFPAARAYKF